MAIIKKNVGENVEEGELSYPIGENINWNRHCGNTVEVSQKTENGTTVWPSNSIPGYISPQNSSSKRYMHSSVHSSIICNSQDIEATWVSINRWMDKENVVYVFLCAYTYTVEYYSAMKKNEIVPLVAIWMDLEGIMLDEIGQRETNTVWYHSYGILKI